MTKMFHLKFGVKNLKVSTLESEVENGYRALERYPFNLESPCHTYGLSLGRCSLLNLVSNGQRSSAQESEVEIQIPDSKTLPFQRRVTISHIPTTNGTKIFPTKFGIKTSKVKCNGKVEIRFLGSKTLPFQPRVTISHICTTHEREMFPVKFRVKRSSALDIKTKRWFWGFKTFPFPPRVTVCHIWNTKGKKMWCQSVKGKEYWTLK
jgi:hypothetical protein